MIYCCSKLRLQLHSLRAPRDHCRPLSFSFPHGCDTISREYERLIPEMKLSWRRSKRDPVVESGVFIGDLSDALHIVTVDWWTTVSRYLDRSVGGDVVRRSACRRVLEFNPEKKFIRTCPYYTLNPKSYGLHSIPCTFTLYSFALSGLFIITWFYCVPSLL